MTIGEEFFVALLTDEEEEYLFKVRKYHLLEKQEIAIYDWIIAYYKDNNQLPEFVLFKKKFGSYSSVSGSVKFHFSELENRYIYTAILERLPKEIKDAKANPKKSLEKIRSAIGSITPEGESRDLRYEEDAPRRLKDYSDKLKTGGITYISTGNGILDKILLGYHRGDLLTFGARGGMGKTWWLLNAVIECEEALPEHLGPILISTNEMPAETLMGRIDCIKFKLNYEAFRSGELKKSDLNRYRKGLKILEKIRSRIVIVDQCNTLEALEAKVIVYNPAILFVDGSYLYHREMDDGLAKSAFLTRGFKALALRRGIPIIETVQLRKKTGKSASRDMYTAQDEFYYGTHVQDSDYVLKGYQTPEMVFHQEMGIEFVKGRNIAKGISLIWIADVTNSTYQYRAASTDASYEEEGDLEI